MNISDLREAKKELKQAFTDEKSLYYWIEAFAKQNNLCNAEIGFLLLDLENKGF